MKINPVIKIGIGVTLAVVAAIWGMAFLKGKNLLNSEQVYYAEYTQVEGLTTASPVMMHGLKVGIVQSIEFYEKNNGSLVVGFAVDDKYRLPIGSTAQIYSMDLMGTKALQIVRGDSTKYYASGDTLTGNIETDLAEAVNRQILPLKNKAEKLMSSLDSVLAVVQQIFSSETQDDIQNSFASISRAIKAFESLALRADTMVLDEKERVALVMGNMASITDNLKKNNENISKLLANAAMMTDSLSQHDIGKIMGEAESAVTTLNGLLQKINKGEGSLGALMNNDTLYTNLESATRNLDYLLVDFRKNPKKYIHFSLFDRGNTYVLDKESMDKMQEKNREIEKQKQSGQKP